MNAAARIQVLLADDQTLVRQGIRALLELSDRISVMGEVANGRQLLDFLQQHRPDVVLLDVRMPVLSGLDALQQLQREGRMVPTIVLTTFDDEAVVLQALRCGARGFLLKDVTLDSLVTAIEQVHGGGKFVQPLVTEHILQGLGELPSGFDSAAEPESLSPKETEILRLLAGGYSNREIALAVHRSEGTVKNQVSAVLAKLGVRDRTRAVLRAIELGLIGKS